MSKRRLSQQQQHRIQKRVNAQTVKPDPNCQSGIIVAHNGKLVDIKQGELFDDNKPIIVSGHIRANLPTLVCGDRVLFKALNTQNNNQEQNHVVEQITTRTSVLNRPRPYSDPKPVAANIDLILVVIAPEPEPISGLIDRYIVAAEQTNINIAILINKTDLMAGDKTAETTHADQFKAASPIEKELAELTEIYASLGYPVFELSSQANTIQSKFKHTQSKDALFEFMDKKTCILVGQSGVGKSSIINAVAKKEIAETGKISSNNLKGKHTTTHSYLFELDLEWQSNHQAQQGQSAIIDSPGIREFGLWHLDHQDIANGFREFRGFIQQCKYRDCDHKHSQGCALQAAFKEGKIHPKRISSYQNILSTNDKH